LHIKLLYKDLHSTLLKIVFFRRAAYTTLYNVSNKFNGHSLMENNKLIQILNNDIKLVPSWDNNSIILFSLNLLLSLTEKINKSMYAILKNEVSTI